MTDPRVRYVDGEPNGLAAMVGGLIEANLNDDPRRARLLRPATVDLVAIDADVGVRLQIGRDEVRVADITRDRPHLRITADAITLVEVASVPLRLGVPDPLSPRGRAIVRKIWSRDIAIEGLLRHPLTLTRLTRLLTVL